MTIDFETGAEGFEPPNGWTKTSCLTAWRRPITENLIDSSSNILAVSFPCLSSPKFEKLFLSCCSDPSVVPHFSFAEFVSPEVLGSARLHWCLCVQLDYELGWHPDHGLNPPRFDRLPVDREIANPVTGRRKVV